MPSVVDLLLPRALLLCFLRPSSICRLLAAAIICGLAPLVVPRTLLLGFLRPGCICSFLAAGIFCGLASLILPRAGLAPFVIATSLGCFTIFGDLLLPFSIGLHFAPTILLLLGGHGLAALIVSATSGIILCLAACLFLVGGACLARDRLTLRLGGLARSLGAGLVLGDDLPLTITLGVDCRYPLLLVAHFLTFVSGLLCGLCFSSRKHRRLGLLALPLGRLFGERHGGSAFFRLSCLCDLCPRLRRSCI